MKTIIFCKTLKLMIFLFLRYIKLLIFVIRTSLLFDNYYIYIAYNEVYS